MLLRVAASAVQHELLLHARCSRPSPPAALRFLHARGIAHRDIKPENVLIGLQEGAQDARHALLALTEAAGAGVGAAADVPGAATDVPRAATDLPRAATDLPDAGMPHGATSDTVDTCSSAASVSVASVALEHGFAPTDPLLGPWPAVREELLRLVGTVNRRGDQAATVDPAVRSAAVRRLRSTFMVKLCDFGSSAIQRGSEVGQAPIVGHSACGSRRFASPEVVRAMDMGKRPEIAHLIWPGTLEQWDTVVQRGYDAAACDVYSFGLLVYALASGHLPYAAASLQEKMYRRFVATLFPHVRHSVIGAPGSELWSVKVNGPQLRRWRWPSHFSPALKHLLMHCLSPLPHERMTMEEVLQHPWFEQPQWRPEAVPDPPAVPIEAAARETSNPPPAVPSVTLPALSPGPGGATTSAGMPTQHRRGGAGGSGSVTPGLGSSGLEGDEDRATLRSAQAEPRGMSGMSSVFSSGVGSRGGWDDSSGLVSPGAVAAAASPARAVLSPPRGGGARAPQHPPPSGSTLMQTPLPDVLEGTGE